MRALIIILYCAAVLIVGIVLLKRNGELEGDLVASHNLPADHLLTAGDLVPTDILFLQRSLSKGERLRPGDAASLPALTPGAGTLPVALAALRSTVEADALNAGIAATFCRGSEPIVTGATVRATLCHAAAANCIIVAEIAIANAEPLAEALAVPGLTLRAADRGCE